MDCVVLLQEFKDSVSVSFLAQVKDDGMLPHPLSLFPFPPLLYLESEGICWDLFGLLSRVILS